MEKTPNAVVVPLNAGWSDIGSWTALWEVSDKDDHGNVFKGDVVNRQSRNTYVHADSRLVAAVGLEDLVIVETTDAVLVAHKNNVQEVKHIVEQLKSSSRTEHLNQRTVYRPWGIYECVANGHHYQVKRITVKPGAKLSVQMHRHSVDSFLRFHQVYPIH